MKIRLLEALLKADLVYVDGREVAVCPDLSTPPEQVICVAYDGTEENWVFNAQDVQVDHADYVHGVSTDGDRVKIELRLIRPMPLVHFMVKE